MRGYTNIPVSLCEFALVNRKINQLKLYIHLKLNSDGFVVYDEKSYKEWSKEIGISSKTIKTSLDWLIKNKWITVNGKRNALHIISYKKIGQKIGLNFKSGILFEPTCLADYEYFKAFCCATVICYYLNKKRYFDRQSVIIKGVATTNCKRTNGFYPMPNGYLAKCLGVSLATAFRFKKEAEDAGFIETKAGFGYLLDEKDEKDSDIEKKSKYKIKKVKNKEKIFKTEDYEIIKQILVDVYKEPNRLRKGKRYLKWVESDLIHCVIKTKKKGYGKN